MTSEELQAIIATSLPCEYLDLSGDGRHWYATIVSSAFEG
ncbi:MAG: BolA family transcriptional regulator, partial [Polaromonas sp.]